MRFIAADDEEFALLDLKQALEKASPDAEITVANNPELVLKYVEALPYDAAFLDVEMFGMTGIELAERIKKIQPDIRIIFVTGYEKYAIDAFRIHATGYLMKPVSAEAIKRELSFIYEPRHDSPRIRIQTFGGFDVFVAGIPIIFKRAKAKELLAYIVDRRGASLTIREAADVLFEDGKYDISRKNYMQTIVADLRSSLKQAGAESIIIKTHNSIAVDTTAFECDYYLFLNGDAAAINSYRGDYLPAYSWSEMTAAQLDFSIT